MKTKKTNNVQLNKKGKKKKANNVQLNKKGNKQRRKQDKNQTAYN